MIMDFLDWIVNNTYIAFIIALLGLIWGIVIPFIQERKVRRLSVVCATYSLVRKGKTDNQNMIVSYKGKDVSDFSITRFTVWNSGKRAVRSEDLAYDEGIKFYWDNSVDVLDVNIIKCSDASNAFC